MTGWDDLYARIVAATGWSWDQVDALTIPRYRAMQRHWRDYPPAHLLLRALVGYRPPSNGRQTGGGFAALAALAPSGTLNVAALRAG